MELNRLAIGAEATALLLETGRGLERNQRPKHKLVVGQSGDEGKRFGARQCVYQVGWKMHTVPLHRNQTGVCEHGWGLRRK